MNYYRFLQPFASTDVSFRRNNILIQRNNWNSIDTLKNKRFRSFVICSPKEKFIYKCKQIDLKKWGTFGNSIFEKIFSKSSAPIFSLLSQFIFTSRCQRSRTNDDRFSDQVGGYLRTVRLIARKSRLSYEWRGKKQRDAKLDGGFSSGSSRGD